MAKIRRITEADIRLSSSGNIIAAPQWAYEFSSALRGRYQQIEEVWRLFHAKRKRERERRQQAHERRIQNLRDQAEDPAITEMERESAKHELRIIGVPCGKPAYRRPKASLNHPTHRASKLCSCCGEEFFGLGAATLCSERCAARQRRAQRSRYKPKPRRVRHGLRKCLRCGNDFLPKRADAVYCSGKCRVAHHRQRD